MAGNQYPDGCAACASLAAAPQKPSWAQRAKASPSPAGSFPSPELQDKEPPKPPRGCSRSRVPWARRRLRWLKAELPLEPGARAGKGDPMAAEIEI